MTKYKIELKWGVIFAIIGLIWMYFEKSMGWHSTHIDKHATYTLFFFPIAVLLYIFALREKKVSLGGSMTWKQGFISGIIIGFIVAILSPLTQYITHTIISPDYFTNIIQYAIENPQGATEEDLRSFFNLGNYIKMAMMQAPIAGAITAGIISLFLREN
jgi:hypothetical protein